MALAVLSIGIAGCSRSSAPPAPARAPHYAPVPDFLADAGYADGADFTWSNTVADGLTHHFDATTSGPLTLTTVRLNLDAPGLELEVEKASPTLLGAATVADVAARILEEDPSRPPLVVMNADFWGSRFLPVNLLVDDGDIWKGPWYGPEGQRRSMLARGAESGKLTIGLPAWHAALQDPESGHRLSIDAINPLVPEQPTVLYTHRFGRGVPDTPPGWRAVRLRLNGNGWLPNAPSVVRVEAVGDVVPEPEPAPADEPTADEPTEAGAAAEESPAPEPSPALEANELLLMTRRANMPWLFPGADLHLTATLDNLDEPVDMAVGGGPRLIADGRVVVDQQQIRERFPDGFDTTRHPRSAVGITADNTLVLMVVDGRQPDRSRGVSLQELADLMLSAGCVDAMNLDGGGSSTIWIDGAMANFPSDRGGPRTVTNTLVIRKAPVR